MGTWCFGDGACGAEMVLGAILPRTYHAPPLYYFASMPHVPVSETVCVVVCCSPAVVFLRVRCETEDIGTPLSQLFGFLFIPECDDDGRVGFGCLFLSFGKASWGYCQFAFVLVFHLHSAVIHADFVVTIQFQFNAADDEFRPYLTFGAFHGSWPCLLDNSFDRGMCLLRFLR